jgi:putative flippase GtrA
MIATYASMLRFLLVGGSNTLVGLTAILIAVRVFGLNDLAANAIGYLIGFFWSFGLNRRWTFRHSGSPKVALVRYALVCSISYALNVIVLMAIRSVVPGAHLLAQLGAVITYSVAAYYGSRYFAFRAPAIGSVLWRRSGARR